MQHGKPTHRPALLFEHDYTIVERYQAEYRGVVQYYLLASRTLSRLHWLMQQSLIRTWANKHKAGRRAMLNTYRSTVHTHGTMKCPFQSRLTAADKTTDHLLRWYPAPTTKACNPPRQLPLRFDGSRAHQTAPGGRLRTVRNLPAPRMHHIRKLADLKVKGRKEKPSGSTVWLQGNGKR